MNSIICVIEQEAKYVRDSAEGSRDFRSGYLAALGALSEFLIAQSNGDLGLSTRNSQTLARLSSFYSLNRSLSREDGSAPSVESLRVEERGIIENVLIILRSGGEEKDYLEWWLRSYGGREWHETSRRCPIFPDQTVPKDIAELDALDRRLEPFLASLTARG